MAVNLKLLNYARQMAKINPSAAEIKKANDVITRVCDNSLVVKGLKQDVFKSTVLSRSVDKLENEFGRIKAPKRAQKRFAKSILNTYGDCIEGLTKSSCSLSETQASRLKLKKAVQKNKPLKTYLKRINHQLGKSESAKEVSSLIDRAGNGIMDELVRQKDLPEFMKLSMDISRETLDKGSLNLVREFLKYLTK